MCTHTLNTHTHEQYTRAPHRHTHHTHTRITHTHASHTHTHHTHTHTIHTQKHTRAPTYNNTRTTTHRQKTHTQPRTKLKSHLSSHMSLSTQSYVSYHTVICLLPHRHMSLTIHTSNHFSQMPWVKWHGQFLSNKKLLDTKTETMHGTSNYTRIGCVSNLMV